MDTQLFTGRAVDEFASAYNGVIEPKIGEIARARRIFRLMWLAIALVILAVCAGIGVLLAGLTGVALVGWIAMPVGLVGAWWAGRLPRALYADKVRSIIIDPIVRFVGDIRYSHQPTTPFDIARFRELELLPASEQAWHEDTVEGRYRERDFRAAELRLTSTVRRANNSHTRQVFHGLIFDIAVPRSFTGRVVLAGAPNKFTKVFADWTRARRGLALVEIGDPDFARQFRVYADDPALARELLDDAARANLVALALASGRAGIAMAFYNGRLLVTLDTRRNLVDLGALLRVRRSLEDDVRRTLRDMTITHRVIDFLNGDRPAAL